MQSSDNNTQTFLALLRAGLWEKDIRLSKYGEIDFDKVYQLAEEQSVTGLVAAGFGHVLDVKAPQQLLLKIVGQTLLLEQRNRAMNAFIADLIRKMRKNDIYALLVKGQGIAQCYERPLWRCCGDVDLLLNEDDYQKAKSFLKPLAQSQQEEYIYTKHIEYTIDSWSVELHGSLRSELFKRIDKGLDKTQNDVFLSGNVRSWINGSTHVFLPGFDSDVIFVFTHILQHFYKWGIGLRQICDWCRLLWTYSESLNHELLESRIRKMGLMSEWKTFASFAVNILGMPQQNMPFYSSSKDYLRKANRILEYVLETGNLGHNIDMNYYSQKYFLRKIVSLWRHTKNSALQFLIFPLDSIKVWLMMVIRGSIQVSKGK